MKTKLHTFLVAFFLLFLPILNFAQAPDLKTSADFILFTSSGGITNTGVSRILGGAIGTDFGALTGFDDVNCVKHIQNAVTAQAKLDLQAVYDEISTIVPTATIAAASLSGGTITPGIYQIDTAVDITIDLTLDAQNNPDALFIFKVTGAIAAAASVNILLINGASVNNVFWHGNAAIGAGASASLKGTFMTNAGAIAFGAGAILEGRALTVIGDVTMSGSTFTGCIMPEATTVTLTQPTYDVATGTIEVTAPLGAGMSYSIDGIDFTNTTGLFEDVPGGEYTVTSKNGDGCISWIDVVMVGYVHVPTLGTAADFILLTSSGSITNTGVSYILGGAIGTNAGALIGFDDVDCVKHIENDVTAQAKLDLQAVYDEIADIVPTDIITAASLIGGTITPGIYQIDEAVALSDHLTLNALGNPDALFIIKVTGAISTAASVNILLINGASVNNIFWHGTGAIGAGASASLKGTFMTNAGAIAFGAGATLEGRALTVVGEITMSGSTFIGCIMNEETTVTLTQPTCSVATGTIEITAPFGAGMTYSIDGTDFTNTSGLFTKVPAGDYTVTSKNTDGCLSMTSIKLRWFPHPPTLGTVTDFVLFTSAGAVGNTGVSTITGGAIGTNFGDITGFELIDCEKYRQDDKTAQCSVDLQAAFDEIDALVPTETITAASLNGGEIFPGIYHINEAAAVSTSVTLDAENDPNAIFIFKVTGAFSLAASVEIILENGASLYNVFWNVDGAVSAGAGATLRGTFLALAGAISLGAGATLEGRALSIVGAVTIDNSSVSVCIRPDDPIVTLTQPNCSENTGSITVVSPTAVGMTYRIDYCAFTNTTGIFTEVIPGTYLVTAMNSEGCISDGTTVIINEGSPPITWTGSVSYEWNNAENWDLDEIPGAYCDAIIPINAVVNISSDTPAESKALSIGEGAVLTIEAGETLTVNETLTNNAGVVGLVIKNGGSLIHNTPNVLATMERLFDTAESWRLVSSPVIGQSINEDWTPSGSYPGGHGYDFYAYDEATETWLNQKVGANNITQFLSGKGYLVSFQVAGQTKAFVGDLLTGDITIEVSHSSGENLAGCNLIGNPYPSGIDWHFADRTIFLDDFAYVYDRTSTLTGITEGYKTVDGGTTDAYIATNQGFFVIKETTGTATFSFNNAMRGHGGVFTKEASNDEVLVLQLGNGSYYDQAILRIIDNASFTHDRSDAMKFYSHNDNMPQLYSYTSDQLKVAINSIPAIDEEKVITLGGRLPANGSYTISASEISGRFQNSPLYLVNNKSGEVHNLKENPQYNFQGTEGDEPALFEIWFAQPTFVPQQPEEEFTRIYAHGQTLYMVFGIEAPGRILEVFDISGRKLTHRSLGNGLQLNVQLNLQTGVYIVRIIGGGEAKTKRIYIE